jgi:hypothetical protein
VAAAARRGAGGRGMGVGMREGVGNEGRGVDLTCRVGDEGRGVAVAPPCTPDKALLFREGGVRQRWVREEGREARPKSAAMLLFDGVDGRVGGGLSGCGGWRWGGDKTSDELAMEEMEKKMRLKEKSLEYQCGVLRRER